MLRPDRTSPEGAAVHALREAIADIQERDGSDRGEVVEAVESWLAQFDFTEPSEHGTADQQPPAVLVTLGVRYLLAVAGRTYPSSTARDDAIRTDLGIAPARYFLLLNAVLDQVDALRLDPVLVNRLQRLREAQRTARESAPPA
ncbi:DUF3263 domain-containing protein [Streptomyces sp. NPDC059893]|uniref:DUF3263 domain-containing protein n=1 Tax=Streptomyces sp. NPDC059893 TaxID=3346990 RepID=UPI0036499774